MDYRNRIIGLEYIHSRDLANHPGNWRDHPKPQVEALKGVLSEVGVAGALLAYRSERNGGKLTTIDGHLRKDAAPQQWPVLVLDVNDAEADYLLAVVDPLAAMAQADAAALDALLASVNSGDAAVQAMLAELAEDAGLYGEKEAVDAEPQVDRAEELRALWGVESGQLWALGDHRLVCGDCTDAAVVARVLQGETPKLMVTDPPYGVDYDADWRNEAAAKGLLAYAARRVGQVENDSRNDWCAAWRLFAGDVLYCWHDANAANVFQTGIESVGFEIRNQIVWVKPNFPISRGHYTWRHEACWYAVRKGHDAAWVGDAKQCTVWEGSLDKNVEGGHSTQKPVWLMAKAIANHAGDVYEPFSGSGTTIIACEQLGRKCRAVEISEGYTAVAIQRYFDATGREPVRVEG